ncbi:GtrA family protein [Aestuariimicrobium sp. Y1814]|uniref:GtrA family protein n=1 Tax=Aestuariimicrobium sp. Y1814 TaxID=3418742 RepID=UPI003DA7197A
MTSARSGHPGRPAGPAERWFAAFITRLHGALPGVLRHLPVTFVGFAILNGFAFLVDLALLWVTHGQLGIAYPVAVSLSFGLASVLAFFLNKLLNFRAHGDVGKQSAKYLVVIVSNYVIWILAFSTLLEWLGVHYQVARVTAACLEGLYIYTLSRFWVFPRRRAVTPAAIPSGSAVRQPVPEAH